MKTLMNLQHNNNNNNNNLDSPVSLPILISNRFTSFLDFDHPDKSFHKKKLAYYEKFPKDIRNLKNIIFYGPQGVGKYTQCLNIIKKYSDSKLKYEKKISIPYQKSVFCIKMSDIHYEIDLSILGCHSKTLWNSIFENIQDIITTKHIQKGIVVCKNFHKIHPELLSMFYSYMQTKLLETNKIIFFIITEQLSFIPSNIINICKTLHYERPSRNMYNKTLNIKIPTKYDINKITNMFNLKHDISQLMIPHQKICDNLIQFIKKYIDSYHCTNKNTNDEVQDDCEDEDENDFMEIRNILYNILTYHINVESVLYYVIKELTLQKYIKQDVLHHVLLKTYTFLQYYNNNYRPIYHLESFVFNLIVIINKSNTSSSHEC